MLLTADESYNIVIQQNQHEKVKAHYESKPNVESVDFEKGYYYVTEIGTIFISACYR